MQVSCIPLAVTRQFSSLFQAFISKNESLKPFYGEFPDPEGFRKQIETKSFDAPKRQTLVSVLEKQYQNLDSKPDFSVLLQNDTYTVTTGHQLNLFTGPLYLIFKLVTTINLAKKLKEAFPEKNFVPVYWMATEDHDFEEINHFRLSGKTYTWHTKQTGAVGRMNPQEMAELFKEIPEHLPLFEAAYLKHDTLTDAVRYYIHQLFGSKGLICLDADDRELKAEFRTIIEDDVFNHTAFDLVQKSSEELEKLGYKSQVTPREINFFYLENSIRERFVPTKNGVHVNDTKLNFTNEEVRKLLDASPEVFSPNVILRPVYQEVILPNLAYLGGPGELAYWLQLKPVFDHYQIPYPILMPRNFGMVISAATQRRITNLGLTAEELFENEIDLRHQFVKRHAEYSLDIQDEIQTMLDAMDEMRMKALEINRSLDGHIKAEKQKLRNWAERLQRRLIASEAHNQGTGVRHLAELKEHLFPGGGLQERTDNFLNFYLNNTEFITQLLEIFDPFRFEFYLLNTSE